MVLVKKSGLEGIVRGQLVYETNKGKESTINLPDKIVYLDYDESGDCSRDYLLTETAEKVVDGGDKEKDEEAIS